MWVVVLWIRMQHAAKLCSELPCSSQQFRTNNAEPCISTSIDIVSFNTPMSFSVQTSRHLHVPVFTFFPWTAFVRSDNFADITVLLAFRLKNATYISPEM